MEQFGAYLKAQREKKGIRLEEIASITKIHLHSLELLESNQWEQLPPEPFIRGFIIAYAKYVGLDTKEIVNRYLEEVGATKVAEATPEMKDGAPRGGENPNEYIQRAHPLQSAKIVIGVTAFAALIVVASVTYIGKKATTHPDTTPTTVVNNPHTIPPVETKAPEPAKTDTRIVANTPNVTPTPMASDAPKTTDTQTPPADAKHTLAVEIKDRTWVKLVIDDSPPQEFYLESGAKPSYWAKEKIKLVLGYAGDSKVSHNGTVASGNHFEGTVKFWIYPHGSRFPQDKTARRANASKDTAPPPPTIEDNSSTQEDDE